MAAARIDAKADDYADAGTEMNLALRAFDERPRVGPIPGMDTGSRVRAYAHPMLTGFAHAAIASRTSTPQPSGTQKYSA